MCKECLMYLEKYNKTGICSLHKKLVLEGYDCKDFSLQKASEVLKIVIKDGKKEYIYKENLND